MVAEGLRVKSAAVSMMLRKMRTKFPSKEDEKLMQSVFETLTESADIETNTDTDNNKIEPIIGEDKGSTAGSRTKSVWGLRGGVGSVELRKIGLRYAMRGRVGGT
jgi:hypothetical protein